MTSSKLSKKFDSPLIINIKISWFLGGLLAGSHAGAGALLWTLPWPGEVQLALTAGLMMSLIHALRRHALRQDPKAITGLEIDTDGDYSLRTGQAGWTACQYIESFQSEWLAIVRLKLDTRRWPLTVLLARDAVEPNAFRELRARLHFQAPPQGS